MGIFAEFKIEADSVCKIFNKLLSSQRVYGRELKTILRKRKAERKSVTKNAEKVTDQSKNAFVILVFDLRTRFTAKKRTRKKSLN